MSNSRALIYRITEAIFNRFLTRHRRILIKTVLWSFGKKSDKVRWQKKENLYTSWEGRSQLMAEWIPENTSVMEFGCGNMHLQKYLPKNCKYTPSDIVKRDQNTIVIDLNKHPLPNISAHDIFFFSGVLEYVYDVENLIKILSKKCRWLILSYTPCQSKSRNEVMWRRSEGWVNDYSLAEFMELLSQNGFHLIKQTKWKQQSLFCLENFGKKDH